MSWWQLTEIAEEDLECLEEYIATDNPDAAARIGDDLIDSFDLLAENREVGRLRTELGENIRSWVVGSYVVYYEPSGEGVAIMRIRHGRRDVLDAADLG